MMMNFFVLDGCSMDDFQKIPDVYLRDDLTDDGTEPYTGVFANSPDLIVMQNLVPNGQAAFGHGSGTENDDSFGYTMEYGQDNYIYVRFSNRIDAPDKVTADLYWTKYQTLNTPGDWNYIGETNPVIVPDSNSLIVADPVTWPTGNLPLVPWHYALIAVMGSDRDPKPITPQAVANYVGQAWSSASYEFFRPYNNAVQRGISVWDNIPDQPEFPFTYTFGFKGAPDQDRRFDMVFINRFSTNSVDLVIPNENTVPK